MSAATSAFVDITSMGEKGIPRAILEKAEGILFFPAQERIPRRRGQGPNTLKTARLLDIDARGLFSIRGDNGTWSVPAFLTLAGSSTLPDEADLVLVIVSRRAVDEMKGYQFDLGARSTVAPGPVTGDTQAWTDQQRGAEVFAYSRARGALTGLSLSAGILQGDTIAHQRFYGEQLTTAAAVAQTSGREPVPAWQNALAKHTSR
jgi:lipid-binding SYLF domain-containing protein